MAWDRPILTDSGGFQIFSLANLTKISEEGARFRSHIDGSPHLLTPEGAIDIQEALGADIMMCLDQCIGYPASEPAAAEAMQRTHRWAVRCKSRWRQAADDRRVLFGIVQGGMHPALRRRSAERLQEIGFPGYAVGGLSVGEPKPLMRAMAEETIALLPDTAPRYVMGVGTPEDLVELVACGADMFDCVLPTRNARNGQLFTRRGALNIANARFREDPRPIEENCTCATCNSFSRAYLRHLYMSRELLAYRLNTLHNVHYFLTLMRTMRSAIADSGFSAFYRRFYADRTPDRRPGSSR
jgi:queuine tRNA-ribosyltransferase